MSFKELGTDYACDLCDKVVHSLTGRPDCWSRIEATVIYGVSATRRFDVCRECWPQVGPEPVKSLLTKLKEFCKPHDVLQTASEAFREKILSLSNAESVDDLRAEARMAVNEFDKKLHAWGNQL